MQRSNSEARKPDQNFSGLHGFLLKHVLSGWGAALLVILCHVTAVLSAAERPRLAVLTDIGGDPDDRQSMSRLMVYANEFDLELLLASAAGTPRELKESITRPDLIHEIV